MGIITDFFTLPRSHGAGRLSASAALCLAIAAFAQKPALNGDSDIPDRSALRIAHGHVTSVTAERSSVTFLLGGLAGSFEYPAKAGASALVDSALRAAGRRDVAVLYDPGATGKRPGDATSRYPVWQVSIGGNTVRSFAECRDAWRADNAWARWVLAFSLVAGVYFAVLALKARRPRGFR